MHALQVFRYVVLVNVLLPAVLVDFCGYLEVTTGNVEEFEQFIPDLVTQIAINMDQMEKAKDTFYLHEKFEHDGGIESPFMGVLYARGISMGVFGLLVVTPIVWAARRICKKCKLWSNIWNSVYFNGVLRTLVEMYIELALGMCLNLRNMRFENSSFIVLSCICAIFGVSLPRGSP